ncbi:Sfum_1244 family protein [Thermodesulfobacteriota bacterium]
MLDIDSLSSQVLKNCCISDSHHAGLYSVCGLALRLRDLYKWEQGLAPWIETESSVMLEWIGDKEDEWDRLAEREFAPITLMGSRYDPFNVSGINNILEPYGLYYGAGYARSLKPTFFLAELEEKQEINGHLVLVLGRELARDLFTMPALTQDDTILFRRESAQLYLWDQIIFLKKSGRRALKFGLENYGLKDQEQENLKRHLARIAEAEMGTYIFHELGELEDNIFDRTIWREIIAAFPHSPIELLVRTVKDLLADTNEYGPLQHIMKERKISSLAFFAAFLDGLRKELFPELIEAFQAFTLQFNWQLIEQAVAIAYNRAKHYALDISGIYLRGKRKKDMGWVESEIERRLLEPLGIKRNKQN